MRAAVIPSQGSEFQTFLYAPICHDDAGMTLSVLSALARQDVDPWTEAARLSRLPEETAVKEIINLLDALPHQTLGCLDRVEVAGRLCALLPRRLTSNRGAPLQAPSAGEQNPAQVVSLNWHFLTFYICLMLLLNWLAAEFHAPRSASAESASPPVVAEEAPNTHSKSDSPGNPTQ